MGKLHIICGLLALLITATAPHQAAHASAELSMNGPPVINGCTIFPADNIWNMRVDQLPRDLRSNAYVRTIGVDDHVHADFGSGAWNGGPIEFPFYLRDPSDNSVELVTREWWDDL